MPLMVTGTYKWSEADVEAELTEEGGVSVWFEYKKIGQKRHEFTCSPEEWDRLVAWVEWQRKEMALKKKGEE